MLLGQRCIEETRRYARLTDKTREEEYFRAKCVINNADVRSSNGAATCSGALLPPHGKSYLSAPELCCGSSADRDVTMKCSLTLMSCRGGHSQDHHLSSQQHPPVLSLLRERGDMPTRCGQPCLRSRRARHWGEQVESQEKGEDRACHASRRAGEEVPPPGGPGMPSRTARAARTARLPEPRRPGPRITCESGLLPTASPW